MSGESPGINLYQSLKTEFLLQVCIIDLHTGKGLCTFNVVLVNGG